MFAFFAGCPYGGGGGGGGGDGGDGGGGGGGGGGGEETIITGPVKDCGIHSTIGSCGPASDNCYCGSSCVKWGVGSYQCVWTCSSDADCEFTIKDAGGQHPFSGRCVFTNVTNYCQVPPEDSGGGGGGEEVPGVPAGCINSNVTQYCNPLTNGACMEGEACDLAAEGEGYKLACFPPPNLAGPGEACDNQYGPMCTGGYHCTNLVCRKFCCADTDCGGDTCTPIENAAGPLGTCP